MFEIYQEHSFASAHVLRHYDGPLGGDRLHGHNWKVAATVQSLELDRAGLVLDFDTVIQALKDACEPFDHRLMNDVKPFDDLSPSAERLCQVLFEILSKRLNDARVHVKRIDVWECDGSRASYFG